MVDFGKCVNQIFNPVIVEIEDAKGKEKFKHYEERQIDFVRKNVGFMTNREMAGALLLDVGQVKYLVEKYSARRHKTHKWTEAEVKTLQDNFKHKTMAELSAELGISAGAVTHMARKLGLKKREERPWTKADDRILKKMTKGGLSLADCAKFLNRTRSAISCRRNVLEAKQRKFQNWTTKEEKRLIALSASGLPLWKIAKEMKRGYMTLLYRIKVSGIRRNPNPGKPSGWTSVDVDFLTENAGKMTVKEIAYELGRGVFSVYQKAQKLGIAVRTREKRGDQ